jgi:iron(III) transport system substrate-binding protein
MSARRKSRLARRWLAIPVGLALGASLLAACGGGGSDDAITLYNGQHPQLTQALVDAFSKQTGITVRVRTDDGIVLADELLQEGSSSPADVYLTENSPELMVLSEHHLLAKLPASVTSQIPAGYNSPSANWAGVALRVSALAYDPALVSAEQLPASLLELAQPKWKGKLAVAPTDSDFVPLVGAVSAVYGTARARAWLAGLKTNAALYQDDEAVAAAVDRGQAEVGIVNQYYWYRLQLEVGSAGMHSAIHAFAPGDVGNLANISGAAVLASSHDRSDAQRFVAFLVSQRGQEILASGDDFEYPLRPGVPANPALPPIGTIPTTSIGVVELGSDRQASALLQQAGLV